MKKFAAPCIGRVLLTRSAATPTVAVSFGNAKVPIRCDHGSKRGIQYNSPQTDAYMNSLLEVNVLSNCGGISKLEDAIII